MELKINNKGLNQGQIQLIETQKDALLHRAENPIMNVTGEMKQISFFLQSKFFGLILDEQAAPELFEQVFSAISNEQNEKNKLKSLTIFLDYIKNNLYLKNKETFEQLLQKHFHEPEIRNYALAYTRGQLNNIYEHHLEPFTEVSFLLHMLGIPQEYNIIDDILKNRFYGFKKLCDEKISNIGKHPSAIEIDEFCTIMDIANLMTNILSINSEDKKFGHEFFDEVLIGKTIEAIKTFMTGIDANLKDVLEGEDVDFSKFSGHFPTEDKYNLNKLLNCLGKYGINFSATFEYISLKDVTLEDIDKRVKNILKRISYYKMLRESSQYGNRSGEDLQKIKAQSNLISNGNSAYMKLIHLMKLSRMGIENKENSRLKTYYIMDLLKIYKKTFKGKLQLPKKNKEMSVVNHFLNEKNPTNNQIIIIYKLILFCDFSTSTLIRIARHLIKNIQPKNTFFEKFEIKTIEQILMKIVERHGMSEVDPEDFQKKKNPPFLHNKFLQDVEIFIKSATKDNLIYNYGKLYISLALIYSLGDTDESIEKSQKQLHIFLEKFGNDLPVELEWVREKIFYNIALYEKKKHKKIASGPREEIILEGKKHYEMQRKIFALEEGKNLINGILEMINRILKSAGHSILSDDLGLIQREICKLIEESVYHNLCKISIEPKGKTLPEIKLKKYKIIESDYFNIVFTYDEIYDRTFNRIFEKEKENIKSGIIQLIELYDSLSNTSQNLGALTQLAGLVMERKDEYTKGHVSRVEKLSLVIGKILGFSDLRARDLQVQAFYHDYGKYLVPDEILKNPGQLSSEERATMDKHSGDGVILGIQHGLNIKNLEGMAHHSKFYSPMGDKDLKFTHLVNQIKQGKDVDVHDFRRLMGKNIPIASRIIIIGDIIDAIASRRIYDKRAGWPIEDILQDIDNQLLECSGLKRVGGKVVIDDSIWLPGTQKDLETLPYAIKFDDKIYIPEPDSTIFFDPSIIIRLVGDKVEYDKMKRQIMESDKKAIALKIKEFQDQLEALNQKKNVYQKILAFKRKDVPDEVFAEFRFTEKDEEDAERIKEKLTQQMRIHETYLIKSLGI